MCTIILAEQIVSAAQYEFKFQKWGSAKNLDRRGWQKLFWQCDKLEQQKRETRIVLSDSVVGEHKRKRARRRYGSKRHVGTLLAMEDHQR